MRTGRDLGGPHVPASFAIWTLPHRVLVFHLASARTRLLTIYVVDPFKRKVRKTLDLRRFSLADVTRIGAQYVLTAIEWKHSDRTHDLVLDALGNVRHDFRVPVAYADGSGPIVISARYTLGAADIATGRPLKRRLGTIVLGGSSRRGAVYGYSAREERFLALDPNTLKTVGRSQRIHLYRYTAHPIGARSGFVVPRDRRILRFGADGRLRWQVRERVGEVGVIGRYVYDQQFDYDPRSKAHDGTFRVVVRSLHTGRQVGVYPGRLTLFAPESATVGGIGSSMDGRTLYFYDEG